MKRYIQTLAYLLLITGLVSCEKFLEPENDNRLTEDQMLNDPVYFEGILLRAYDLLPAIHSFNEDYLSDDATTNNKNSYFLRMATGEWTSSFYPSSQWTDAYDALYYLNYFLSKYEEVEWAWRDDTENLYHLQRLKGEAYGLRAYWEFQLLQKHAGRSADGELLGFPIVTSVISQADDFKLPRNTYAECVDQIMADIDTAAKYLPATYSDKDPSKPENIPYNAALGQRFTNRITGQAVIALKSRLALHAASPAFGYLSWEDAARAAGPLIRSLGGLDVLSQTDGRFYTDYEDREIIWANSISSSNSLERQNYPPSEYGYGRTNPTQDLVEVFPMKNGYPLAHENSGYDSLNPYMNRDPRLSKYIIYNGSVLKDTVFTDISSEDGIDRLETSTRSGYYLRKFLLTAVDLSPGNVTNAEHFYTYFRFTELCLNYAEAANEAWGPDEDPLGYGFTARGIISALRTRAGLPNFIFDTYLRSITDPVEFRELIRIERRIELCFEGHRFWDIRRWDLKDVMSAPVHAMRIDFSSETPFSVEFLEKRSYQDYMIYGPVPYEETLKYDIVQNLGWQ